MDDKPFLYTAICGRYEKDRSDIVVFKDKPADKFVDPVMKAKIYKVLPHQFTNAKVRIWMDGNIFPNKLPETLVGELLQDYDIAVFHHPWRKCVYEEHVEARKRLEPKHHHVIDEQISKYKKEAMPASFGLAECGIILSRSGETTREFFERWWSEISRHSSRDQVSFPYVWWKMKDRIKVRLIGTMRQVTAKTRFDPWFRYVER